jgi:cell wall-associated NlpC family hydrolase
VEYKWATQHLCPWRKFVALTMATITAGAWIPFTSLDSRDSRDDEEEFDFVMAPPTVGSHDVVPPNASGKVVDLNKKPPVQVKKPTPKPTESSTPTHSQPTPKQTITPPPVADQPMSILIAFLRAQVGDDYVYGGNGPEDWDCSGLTLAAYAKIGVNLPRTSEMQSLMGRHVSVNSLQTGDLLFWGLGPGLAYHVVIYIGGGHFIGAQNPGTGVVQRSVINDPPDFARRIL